MIRKDKKTFRDGSMKTQIRVTEGYRPYPNASPRQRTVKSFGYLEDQEDLEAFWKEVNACNDSLKHRRDMRIEIPADEMMYSENNRLLNYGYKFPESVYRLLGVDEFLDQYQKVSGFSGKHTLNEIFCYLVMDRILQPALRQESVSHYLNYYGMNCEFNQQDICGAFAQLENVFYDLQRFINDRIAGRFRRDFQYCFYDVTNYYLERDNAEQEEEYRDRWGVLTSESNLGKESGARERRKAPAIRMGLSVDGKGIPVCMDIFNVNMSDSKTLKENLDEFNRAYGIERTVMVGDRGMNSPRNIDLLCSRGDGFVFSQVLRGERGKRYHKAMFEPDGWHVADDGSYEWKMITEEYRGHAITFEERDGKPFEVRKPVTRTRKVCFYWSRADAEMAAKKRAERLRRAEKSGRSSARGMPATGNGYLQEEAAAEGNSGNQDGRSSVSDCKKARDNALFDGYFAVMTSELDYDAEQIRSVYRGLRGIEESFQIMRNESYVRPVLVNRGKFLRAHFLICYVALVIIRLIQAGMGQDWLPVDRIARALRSANCLMESGGYVRLLDVGGSIGCEEVPDENGEGTMLCMRFGQEDQIAQDYRRIQALFGTSFYYAYAKQEDFKRFFQEMELHKE